MYKVAVLFAVVAAFAVAACGDGNKPPPLTPDTDHPADVADGGAPATPEK